MRHGLARLLLGGAAMRREGAAPPPPRAPLPVTAEALPVRLPELVRAEAQVDRPRTLDEENRRVELTFSTGATVRRVGFFDGEWEEELDMAEEAVDLSRLNARANLVNSHNTYSLTDILGVVERAWVQGPKGRREARAEVRFSRRADVEPVWEDVRSGIIGNVSVGYIINEVEEVRRKTDVPLIIVRHWTPTELSLVTVPADPGARVRTHVDGPTYGYRVRNSERNSDMLIFRRSVAANGAAAAAPAVRQNDQGGNGGQPAQPTPGAGNGGQGAPQQLPVEPVQAPVPQTFPGQSPPAAPQPTQPPAPTPAEGEGTAGRALTGQAAFSPPPGFALVPITVRGAAALPTPEGESSTDPVIVERSRIQAIQAQCRAMGLPESVGAHHIAQGTALADAFVSMLMDQQRQQAPGLENLNGQSGAVRVGAGGQDQVETDHRGFSDWLKARLQNREGQIERGSPAAMFVNMELHEAGRLLLERNGLRTHGMAKHHIADALFVPGYGVRGANYAPRFAFNNPMLRAAAGGVQTTTDFISATGIAINGTLLEQYQALPQTFGPFVTRGQLPDFRPAQIYGVSAAISLLPIDENGEYKRSALNDFGETIVLGTYGRIVAFSRQVVINDQIGLVQAGVEAIAAGSRRLESDLVYAQFLGNPVMRDGVTLFHANHGNLNIGGAGAPTVTTIGAARAAMRKQKDLTGTELIEVEPAYLLIGESLSLGVEQIFAPFTPTSPSGAVPESMRRSLTIINEPRVETGVTIDKTVYTGSATQWFLIGRGPGVRIIQLMSLRGNEGLYTEQRVGFDIDGIEYKGRLDIGAKAADWVGVQKNSG